MAMNSTNPQKPWLCPEGHLIGYMFRENRIRRLRVCFEVIDEFDITHTLTFIATGEVEIFCPVCGSSRIWHAGDEAVSELIERRKARWENQ